MMDQLTERESTLKNDYIKLHKRHINQVQQYSQQLAWRRENEKSVGSNLSVTTSVANLPSSKDSNLNTSSLHLNEESSRSQTVINEESIKSENVAYDTANSRTIIGETLSSRRESKLTAADLTPTLTAVQQSNGVKLLSTTSSTKNPSIDSVNSQTSQNSVIEKSDRPTEMKLESQTPAVTDTDSLLISPVKQAIQEAAIKARTSETTDSDIEQGVENLAFTQTQEKINQKNLNLEEEWALEDHQMDKMMDSLHRTSSQLNNSSLQEELANSNTDNKLLTESLTLQNSLQLSMSPIFDEKDKESLEAIFTNSQNQIGHAVPPPTLINQTQPTTPFYELEARNKALNVVQNDLYLKLENLTKKHSAVLADLDKLTRQNKNLVRKCEEHENQLKEINGDTNLPSSQRTHFTRAEMMRILMERNHYKEEYMDLRDAMKMHDALRLEKIENQQETPKSETTASKSKIWNFFSSLIPNSGHHHHASPPEHDQLSRTHTGDRSFTPDSNFTPRNLNTHPRGSRSMMNFTRSNTFDHGTPKTSRRLISSISGQTATENSGLVLKKQPMRLNSHLKKPIFALNPDNCSQICGWSYVTNSIKADTIPNVPLPQYSYPLTSSNSVQTTNKLSPNGNPIVTDFTSFSSYNSKNFKIWCSITYENLCLIGCSNSRGKSHVTAILSNEPKRVIAKTKSEDSTIICLAVVGNEKIDNRFYKNSIGSSNLSNVSSDRDLGTSPDNEKSNHSQSAQSNLSLNQSTNSMNGVSLGLNSLDNTNVSLNNCLSPRAYKQKPLDEFQLPHDQTPIINTSIEFIDQRDYVMVPRPVISAKWPVLFAGCQNRTLLCYSLRLPRFTEINEDSDIQGNEIEMLYPSGRVKLADAIIHITVHWTDRNKRALVFVGLANGTVLMFQKTLGKITDVVNKQTPTSEENEPVWDLTQYYLINLSANTKLTTMKSIGSSISIGRYVWVSIKNTVYVIDTFVHGGDGKSHANAFEDMIPPRVVTCFPAHPRKDSIVKAFTADLATDCQNVWISVKLDSTIRLFSAKAPDFNHLYDIDIQPFISKMIGSTSPTNSGDSAEKDIYAVSSARLDKFTNFVRVTAIYGSRNRLWVGTGNGIIISIPIVENEVENNETSREEISLSPTRSFSTRATHSSAANSYFYIKPDINKAQIALHGFRDAVRFIVNTNFDSNLIIAGGVGSIDFRNELGGNNLNVKQNNNNNSNSRGNDSMGKSNKNNGESSLGHSYSTDKSHLLAWTDR